MSDEVELERMRALRVRRDRITVELNAVEDGTLPWLEGRPAATAEGLAHAFDLSVQAANNRLVRLLEAGLVQRRPATRPGGGRCFLYSVLSPGEPGAAKEGDVSELGSSGDDPTFGAETCIEGER